MLLGHGTQTKISVTSLRKENNVLSCLLKEAREVAVMTLVGRLFYAWAAVTQKDRSPMVRSRVLGTIRCFESRTVVVAATPLRQSIEDRGQDHVI